MPLLPVVGVRFGHHTWLESGPGRVTETVRLLPQTAFTCQPPSMKIAGFLDVGCRLRVHHAGGTSPRHGHGHSDRRGR